MFGLEYKDGVVLAADTLGSYGSMARFNNIPRVIRLNATTLVACSGDYADFQYLSEILEQKQIEEEMVCNDGDSKGDTMSPKARNFLDASQRPFLEKPIRPTELREMFATLADLD